MKRIVNYWSYGLAIVGLIAGGCAVGIPRNASSGFARGDKTQGLFSNVPGSETFQEVWVIERSSSPTNASHSAFQLPPEPSSLRAVVHGVERPMPLRHMDVNATVTGYIGTVDVRQEFEN